MDIWVVFTFFWLFYGQYYYENSWTGFFVGTYVFNSLARIPRNGIAESCGNSMFKLLTNCQTIFQKHLHHFALLSAVRGGSSFSISSPKSISSLFFFFITTSPVDIKWYLIMVLICVSLMGIEAEYFFMYLLAMCIFSLEKCPIESFAHFSLQYLSFYYWSLYYVLQL